MPIEEKSWKEIEEEYASAKREKNGMLGSTGRWGKCPRCQGTGKATCPTCKGLGRDLSSMKKSEVCSNCRGTGKASCPQPGCQGGWVRVIDNKP
jgi:DnaJ-class molecular chaperone